MNTCEFGGLWSYPSREFPKHNDFMFIDEERGRVITLVVLASPPPKYAALRNWYQPASDSSIRARLSPKNEWRTHEYLLDGDRISWTYGGAVHTWRRVSWDDRPDRLDRHLSDAHARMDNDEQAG